MSALFDRAHVYCVLMHVCTLLCVCWGRGAGEGDEGMMRGAQIKANNGSYLFQSYLKGGGGVGGEGQTEKEIVGDRNEEKGLYKCTERERGKEKELERACIVIARKRGWRGRANMVKSDISGFV